MRSRVLLLAAQAVCLGVSTALLIVSATSLFLDEYGAALLPYVYIAVAVAGVVVTSAMTRAQRTLTLAGLATGVLAVVACVMAAGWAALALGGWTWATFPLVVLVFLWIPTGFVLVGAQAGRLLDVQQLKAWFPRIAAGFAAGFGVGGLLAARLVSVLGSPDRLLLLAALVVCAFLVLALVLAARHPEELRQPPEPRSSSSAPSPHEGTSLRRLLGNRLVAVLLGYQLLSAAVTQLLDYLVWSSAADRYPDPADLARFLGLFGALINAVGLLFVFLLAGRLLSRYGLAFGLAANPTGVIALVVVSAAVAIAGGVGTTMLFVLVCAQQVVDIALTDGTTRGSINAAYQALPPRERLAAQTRVEGVGVPGATGAVGVLLLLLHVVGGGVVALLVIVLLLTAMWLVLALSAYRLYATDLRRTITRRSWDPVALRLDDAASREVVARLLASDDVRDVAVAVDALSSAAPERLVPAVTSLLGSDDESRLRLGVEAARRHAVAAAAPSLLTLAASSGRPGGLRAQAALAAAALGVPPESQVTLLAADVVEVRAAAAVALAGGRGRDDDVSRVAGLLDGPERDATLIALASSPSERCVPALVGVLTSCRRAPGLADALSAHARHLPPVVAEALSGRDDQHATTLLVLALRGAPPGEADDVLLAHVDHPDLVVRGALLDVLAARGPHDEPRLRTAMVDEVARGRRSLEALEALGPDTTCAPAARALRDDLAATAERVVALLAAAHGEDVVRRSVAALDGPGRPLALETLEVTAGRAATLLCLPLIDPTSGEADRRAALSEGGGTHRPADDWLDELALDPDGCWHDAWLRAAAVWCLPRAAQSVAARAADDPDDVVAETARAWLDGVLSPAR